MSKHIEAVIFDVDGTLLNSADFIIGAYEHVLTLHGHPVPDKAVIASYIGQSLPACYEALAPGGDFEVMRIAHREFQSSRLGLITAYDGVQRMMTNLKQAKVKLGVFSSRYGSLIPSLEQTGIMEHLDVVVGGDEVSQPKPNPEGILLALGKLSVEPEKAAMVGDAVVDIEAGKRAGVAITIAVTHGFGLIKDLIAAQPNYIARSLSEIAPIVLES